MYVVDFPSHIKSVVSGTVRLARLERWYLEACLILEFPVAFCSGARDPVSEVSDREGIIKGPRFTEGVFFSS